MKKILTLSTLYPNAVQPAHGIFVEARLRRLVATGAVESVVVAPVPWFPFKGGPFGSYVRFAQVPAEEERHGIRIMHPRYPLLPKIGMAVAPFLLAARLLPFLKRLNAVEQFEMIDAHYYYPDGVAAVWLARRLGVPVTVTARGTDINLIPKHRLARRMIDWAARHADRSITVCQALKDEMARLGHDPDAITVLRNGVDLEAFAPVVDRDAVRRELGLSRETLLSVGHLIERKGHGIVIESLLELPDVDLIVVGEGPLDAELKALARRLGVENRVRFVGAQPQPALVRWYNAADALVLASDREGMANVLLESLACGTPVVATRVWGSPEVVSSPEAGVLAEARTANGIAAAYRDLTANRPSRSATRAFAEGFGWEATTEGQIEIICRAVAGDGSSSSMKLAEG